MELKVVCNCGQKYKFDVDPVNRLMPFAVNCPVCGGDGTALANALLAQQPAPPPIPAVPAPPAPPASGGGLRISAAAPAPAALPLTGPAAAPASSRPAPRIPAYVPQAAAKSSGEFNLGLGILGALLGAGTGAALLFVIAVALGFRIPFIGLITGLLAGYGARWLYKGTDHALGVITAVITFVFLGGTLFLLFGIFAIGSIISLLVSVSVAYRIAST